MTATLMQQILDFPEQNVKKNSLQSLLYSLHFLDYHTPEVSFTQVLSNTHQTENIKYPAPFFVVFMVVVGGGERDGVMGCCYVGVLGSVSGRSFGIMKGVRELSVFFNIIY